jgi:hypothetical protein
VTEVTLDALRRFSSISIETSGPAMKIVIVLRWTRGDKEKHDADVTITAEGVDAAGEREALDAVHNAIKRGGTDREGRRRRFMALTQIATGVAFGVGSIALIIIAREYSVLIPVIGPSVASFLEWAGDTLQSSVLAFTGAFSAIVGVAVGRWAYPALEVAERGETRLWRVARWFGGIAVTSAVAIFLKVALHE